MSLAEKLDQIRAGAAKRIPEERHAIMQRATQDLRDSGIMNGVIRPGNPLPPFVLPNADGLDVRSADLLARGAIVLSVFRGSW
jgi:hypothetical protein